MIWKISELVRKFFSVMILVLFVIVSQILINEKHAICLTPHQRKFELNQSIKDKKEGK